MDVMGGTSYGSITVPCMTFILYSFFFPLIFVVKAGLYWDGEIKLNVTLPAYKDISFNALVIRTGYYIRGPEYSYIIQGIIISCSFFLSS
jgi:hypothetical protein